MRRRSDSAASAAGVEVTGAPRGVVLRRRPGLAEWADGARRRWCAVLRRFVAAVVVLAALPAAAQRDTPENQLLIELLDKVERLQTELNELRDRNDRLQYELNQLKKGFNGAASSQDAAPPDAVPADTAPSPDTAPPPDAPPGIAPPPDTTPPDTAPSDARPPDTAPPPDATSPSPVRREQPTVHGKEEYRMYHAAWSALNDKDYVRLREGLGEFLERYPHGKYAASAKYWIGESWYARRDFDRAETAFRRVVEEHADHQKSEDASVKIAIIRMERGEHDAAREILDSLAASATQKSIRDLAGKKLKLLKKR